MGGISVGKGDSLHCSVRWDHSGIGEGDVRVNRIHPWGRFQNLLDMLTGHVLGGKQLEGGEGIAFPSVTRMAEGREKPFPAKGREVGLQKDRQRERKKEWRRGTPDMG